jgi:hypothetical protein
MRATETPLGLNTSDFNSAFVWPYDNYAGHLFGWDTIIITQELCPFLVFPTGKDVIWKESELRISNVF